MSATGFCCLGEVGAVGSPARRHPERKSREKDSQARRTHRSPQPSPPSLLLLSVCVRTYYIRRSGARTLSLPGHLHARARLARRVDSLEALFVSRAEEDDEREREREMRLCTVAGGQCISGIALWECQLLSIPRPSRITGIMLCYVACAAREANEGLRVCVCACVLRTAGSVTELRAEAVARPCCNPTRNSLQCSPL